MSPLTFPVACRHKPATASTGRLKPAAQSHGRTWHSIFSALYMHDMPGRVASVTLMCTIPVRDHLRFGLYGYCCSQVQGSLSFKPECRLKVLWCPHNKCHKDGQFDEYM